MSVNNESLVDCSPLSQACIKALTDRIEDKRKFAASEIEKMTAEFSMSNNLTMINRLIIVLGRKFCLSSIPNTRKGGLLGLAAVMVGFKNGSILEPPPEVVEEVVCPILTCFIDSDPRVRYYACESLYNVTKVARANILPQFERVFDNMVKVVADPDIGVRGGAELLDRLLRDIINEKQTYDVQTFTIPKLEDYISTKNRFTRLFIIDWIRLLDPKIGIVDNYLPALLDGIFTCLNDSDDAVLASTISLLSEFLSKIVNRSEKISIPSLINTLLKNASNGEKGVAQYTAIAWLRQFIGLMEDHDVINFTPGILIAILPCIAAQHSTNEIETPSSPSPSIHNIASQSACRANICDISSLVNNQLRDRVTTVFKERKESLNSEVITHDLEPILETLVRELQKHEDPLTKLAILDWLKQLRKVERELVFTSTLQRKLSQILIDTLFASSDAVVKDALRVIADYIDLFCLAEPTDDQQVETSNNDAIVTTTKDDDSSDVERKKKGVSLSSGTARKVRLGESVDTLAIQQNTASINRFIQALYKTFRDKDAVFEVRATFIIINLCSIIKSDVIYRAFAEIIKDEKTDLRFAYNLVQKLNQILLTTKTLFGLRSRLGNDDDPEMTKLFYSLYDAWCHSPIATLTLCLLTNNYKHASEIVSALAQMDISMDILTEIDWVVQLIESPVFVSLRMRLLDSNNNQYLLQSLYGLLMILPQSEAYRKLGHRLDQVYKFMSIIPNSRTGNLSSQPVHKTPSTNVTGKDSKKPISSTNIESLMRQFSHIQNLRSRLGRNSENDE